MNKDETDYKILRMLMLTCFGLLALVLASATFYNHKSLMAETLLQEKCIEAKGNWTRVPYREDAIAGVMACQFPK